MSRQVLARISIGLSLLILFLLVQVHFLGDPCMLHGEHTAQAMESTLSCRTMTCLCFLHSVYFPPEAGFSFITRASVQAVEPVSDGHICLLAFDIFHPPRA